MTIFSDLIEISVHVVYVTFNIEIQSQISGHLFLLSLVQILSARVMVFETVAQHVGWPFTDQRQEADDTGHYIVRARPNIGYLRKEKYLIFTIALCLEDDLIVYNLICLNQF